MAIGDKKFTVAFKSYCRTLNLAIKISRLGAGRYVQEDKVVWACILFTKLCTTSKSLRKLLDHDVSREYKADWDYASAFSLTRNIMECYQTLFYLCFDNVNEDELKARKALFNVHDYYSRKQFFSFLSETYDVQKEDTEIENFVLEQLKNSTFFKNLDEKERVKYLKGKNAFFISREDIEERDGVDKNDFRYWYKLLSTNVHSFPMGFFRMIDGDRGTGVHSDVEEKYSTMALEVAENYLIRGCCNMLNFFPDILEKMSPQEKKLLLIE
ncbi:DUF5677 domain-containing protein [Acinetobacter sp. NIPH 2699]|uniref:DUF5677 domain-containing protein n=1 Tax=Acinetobacter sp. NIPH 2699 TaxID=2923433 RepID=UPI001F4C18DA|nr:DUF5677 domain-containing protein [Acinetobacter sp. NIPH 2699]MCH7337934.1 DUF5677 domain-containing protein [Acinetobacter sp. NIPH 2699]